MIKEFLVFLAWELHKSLYQQFIFFYLLNEHLENNFLFIYAASSFLYKGRL